MEGDLILSDVEHISLVIEIFKIFRLIISLILKTFSHEEE